ncbi:methionine adenosyltransferase [Candidatus Woesearchaeota archaeon]|nr:methionine adenosyltransferase [Candidatus Woesearchaeota archaeon]|tara:strand:+ start:17673 stop:18881 length:1209 start_codon:yes stop_codon:yes gene_type:complete
MVKVEFFTSESVTEGHPDKICDQISDAILDEMLRQDPESRCAAECLTTTGSVHVAGEARTKAYVDIQKLVRKTLEKIGYTDARFGIHHEDCGVWSALHEQSADIAQGVDEGSGDDLDQGAGDQGMMFGFACKETPELMPFPIIMAHKLTAKLAEVRRSGAIKQLGPDGKSQVSVKYEDGKPKKITAIVIAQQHLETVSEEELREEIREKVIDDVCGDWIDDNTKIYINATGKFVIGGPHGDSGLTGRKIVVDTYGGLGRHGGGAFSGKDSSKVDRSGAYMARYVAKNVVAADLAEKCEVQLSYSIGISKPTSVNVDTFGTSKVKEEKIVEAVNKVFDLRPKAIVKNLDLKRPIFQKTAAYGHFGREDKDFTWEKTDMADTLRKEAGLEQTAVKKEIESEVKA